MAPTGSRIVGFFVGNLMGVPTWAVASSGAVILLILSSTMHHSNSLRIIKGVSWDVLIFVVGIFVIVNGLSNAGLTDQIERLIDYLSGTNVFKQTMVTGSIAAMFSSVMNNHPTASAMAITIRDMTLEPDWVKHWLGYSALIGGDLGPKMLPIGSLAALLWFKILRNKGVHIPYSLYIRIGIPVTLAAVLASLLALNLEILLFRFFAP